MKPPRKDRLFIIAAFVFTAILSFLILTAAADAERMTSVGMVTWLLPVGKAEPRSIAVGEENDQLLGGTCEDTWDLSPDRILASAIDSAGNLYVGGHFTSIGGVPANNIAKWDGTEWTALGTGLDKDGTVFSLAVSGTDVYAGGSFATAGGEFVLYIAKWDGNTWSALGSGMDPGGYVHAIAVSGTNVYAGGDFYEAGGVPANRIAKWDGVSWSALGTGIEEGYVSALAVLGTSVYAGGVITTAGGLTSNNIARWDGSEWSPLGSGLGGPGPNGVTALAVLGSEVYAGGHFSTAGGETARRIAKWDGSSWSNLDYGIPGAFSSVNALAISGSNLFAGGYFHAAGGADVYHVAAWNGIQWSALGTGVCGYVFPSYTPVLTLVTRGPDLYAGGEFHTASGVPAHRIAKWSGVGWSALPPSGAPSPTPTNPPTPSATPTGTATATSTPTATPTSAPFVTVLQREYPGRFLQNLENIPNRFTVLVNWNETQPGIVRFQINNGSAFEVTADSSGASHVFNMTSDFPAQMTASKIKVTPIGNDGEVGLTHEENVYVFPHPTWLSDSIIQIGPTAFNVSLENGQVKFKFKVKVPKDPFNAKTQVPLNVPFLAGEVGIDDTQAILEGEVTNTGPGNATLTGNTGFKAMFQGVELGIGGTGNFILDENQGLKISDATPWRLQGQGSLFREVSLNESIPRIVELRNAPMIGPLVKQLSPSGKIRGQLKISGDVAPTFSQDPATGLFRFNQASGQFLSKLEGIMEFNLGDRVEAEAYVGGGGGMTIAFPAPYLNLPAPYVQSLESTLEAKAKLTIDTLFVSIDDLGPFYRVNCRLLLDRLETTCVEDGAAAGTNNRPRMKRWPIEPLKREYRRFGQYEGLPASMPSKIARTKTPGDPSTVLVNVFPGADPQLVAMGQSEKLLVWLKQDPALPVLQSTDIAWSYFDGVSWSTPSAVTGDTRIEQSPVLGVDSSGRGVAAWMRIKDAAYTGNPSTLEELPEFYKRFEIVSAIYDPQTHSWGPVSALTDDLALDTNLRLANDNAGNLLLTWQSSPSGEFNPPVGAPATLKYSFWNGTGWNAPETLASGLANISAHSPAIRGTQAFVIIPQDPNLEVTNDSKLLALSWNGAQWSQVSTFAEGGTDHLMPRAYYDVTGEPKVIWLKGTDIVTSRLVDPSVAVVRPESSSLGMLNSKLLTNAGGDLALVWEDVSSNGPANIYAKTYDSGTDLWSSDIRINDETWQSNRSNGFLRPSGGIELTYLSTQINRVTRTVTINGETIELPNIPEAGQTDLKVLRYDNGSVMFDYDADGKTDISVFRSATGDWYLSQSTAGFFGQGFGAAEDRIAPADYDGDGKTDIAVYRPSTGIWYVTNSSDASVTYHVFGIDEDLPTPADYDGDGKADISVFRPSTGTWYRTNSSDGSFLAVQFGQDGDRPTIGDFDGDGKADVAVFRPSTGAWYQLNSSDGSFFGEQFGNATDKIAPADYDGDGKTDIGIYRPSEGLWYYKNSGNGTYTPYVFGLADDTPVAGDYDGDGKADIGVFRPSDGYWYIVNSGAGSFTIFPWGQNGDIPTPNAFGN